MLEAGECQAEVVEPMIEWLPSDGDMEAGQALILPVTKNQMLAQPLRPPDAHFQREARRPWCCNSGQAAPSLRHNTSVTFSSRLTLISHPDRRAPDMARDTLKDAAISPAGRR